jgi:hypothetical protein
LIGAGESGCQRFRLAVRAVPNGNSRIGEALCFGEVAGDDFRLAGHAPPTRGEGSDHISPGVLRIFDRLIDTPAEVVTELGETLRQTPLGVALVGDLASLTGPMRSIGYRWFADPATRDRYGESDRPYLTRLFASGLRGSVTLRGPDSRAARYVDLLLAESAEFRDVWATHEVGLRPTEVKHFIHPELGELELSCQTMLDPNQSHSLLVYTAAPGSESYEKMRLLSVIGTQLTR